MREAFLFILGLFLGSFFGVIIDRLPRGENIFIGRSHCDFCNHTLSWYDLIPVFSFFYLKGKCRYCHKFIGIKYPIIELTTGTTFVFCYLFFQQSSILFIITNLIILSSFIIIFFTDIFSGIIPDSILLILLPLSILRIYLQSTQFIPFLLSGVAAFILFLFLFVVTRGRGMGFGDVKYALVMGLLLGFPIIIIGLYVAFLTGAVCSLILILIGKKGMKSTISFGPFLVLGTITGIIWGEKLWVIFRRILGI